MKLFPSQSSLVNLFALAFGVIIGMAVLIVMGKETKWVVYFVGAIFFVTFLFLIRRQENFIWGLFILSFQAYVSIRLFYGKAGSGGLEFPFVFLLGLLVVAWNLLFSDEKVKKNQFYWGGFTTIPLLIIFIVSFVSFLFSSERFVGVVTLNYFVQYYIFYWIALNFIDSEDKLRKTLWLFFITLVIQSLVYYVQVALGVTFTLTGEVVNSDFGEVTRPGGTISTAPSGYCSFVLLLLCIAIAYFVVQPDAKSKRLWLIPVIVLALIAIALTYTRAAWAGTGLGLAWLLFMAWRRHYVTTLQAVVVSLSAFAALMGLLEYTASLREDNPLDSAYEERLILMRIALRLIADNPLLGVGPGAYGDVFPSYITAAERASAWIYIVHNNYLLRTAETGIIGGMAFIILIVYAIWTNFRLSRFGPPLFRATSMGISAGIVVVSFQLYWDTGMGFPQNALMLFLLGITEAMKRMITKERA